MSDNFPQASESKTLPSESYNEMFASLQPILDEIKLSSP